MLFIRSLIFSVGMLVSTVVAALLLMLCSPLPFRVRSGVARIYALYVVESLRVLCGVNYQVRGVENIPKGAAIIFSKHQSTWETYALQLMFPPQVWVLKRELMWLPFFGWGMAVLKPISINRGAGRKAIKQIIKQGRERLDAGIWVTIFPEGTRVAPGQEKRWGMGGAILAEHTAYPVVPVAHNAGEFWGKRSFIKRPGTIQVIIGEAVQTKDRKAADINTQVNRWMTLALSEIASKASS
ncbi:MAG: 1-acyl-sn-glycerol-3-phosphate acyltransferase [Ectothiorhodospiraceae bacterium]|nr:1-acyl-sn-glycerol-3-phosphate acyltransferase [Ectothiorhodospiraceae bacterium]